jgi:hypothetical protein
MRIAQKITLAIAIALQVVLGSGCTSPVPPTVTRAPMTSLTAHPAIYLQVNVQRPRILDSLRNARIRIAGSFEEADYILTVNVGNRRVDMKCGGMHNIVYILGDRGLPLVEIKGRGLTGDCMPNVFDDMSQTLATYFGS